MRFLLGERVRESYESRAGKRCGKTKSVAAIRKRKKGTKNTRRAVENPNASGTKKQFYHRAEPHIHIKP